MTTLHRAASVRDEVMKPRLFVMRRAYRVARTLHRIERRLDLVTVERRGSDLSMENSSAIAASPFRRPRAGRCRIILPGAELYLTHSSTSSGFSRMFTGAE